ARHMNKDRAAATRDPRAGIVIELDNEVIETVGPPKPVGGRPLGDRDRLVVAAVGGVFAPAVGTRDRAERQQGPRRRASVRAPPEADQPEPATGRAAVALALVGPDPPAAEGHWQGDCPCH